MTELDDLLEGWKRKASLGDFGESAADYLGGDKNTFGRQDKPEGIEATYVDTDKDGNTVAGASIGQTMSRKPYEKAKKESPIATGIGSMLGSATAQLPAFAATGGIGSLPAQLMRNYLVGAGEHALSEEQGGLGDKLKGTAKWTVDHPIQTAVNTILPAVSGPLVKGIGKMFGKTPKGGPVEADVDDIMKEIAEYEAEHGVQNTPEGKADLVRKIMKRRYPEMQDVKSEMPPANDNSKIPEDEDDLMGGGS